MNNKTELYIYGAALGLVVGLVSAHLYGRALEENIGDSNATSLSTGDMVKMGALLFGIVRQVSEFGANVGQHK